MYTFILFVARSLAPMIVATVTCSVSHTKLEQNSCHAHWKSWNCIHVSALCSRTYTTPARRSERKSAYLPTQQAACCGGGAARRGAGGAHL